MRADVGTEVVQMAWSEIFPMKGRSWSDSAVIWMALFGPRLFEFIPPCPQALVFRWAVFVCGSLPQINTPLGLLYLLPSSHVPCPQQHSPPRPLSTCWLLGKLPEGQTVPKWRAEMAGWSPQSAVHLLSPPAPSSKNRDANTDKTNERCCEGMASWQ